MITFQQDSVRIERLFQSQKARQKTWSRNYCMLPSCRACSHESPSFWHSFHLKTPFYPPKRIIRYLVSFSPLASFSSDLQLLNSGLFLKFPTAQNTISLKKYKWRDSRKLKFTSCLAIHCRLCSFRQARCFEIEDSFREVLLDLRFLEPICLQNSRFPAARSVFQTLATVCYRPRSSSEVLLPLAIEIGQSHARLRTLFLIAMILAQKIGTV